MNKSVYITTSIPYVNSKPHVGHAQEFIIADCLARSYRSLGYGVTFQTGTDENAFKNVIAAQSAGLSVKDFVDQNAEAFHRLVESLGVSADTFVRTTDAQHVRGVEKFWSQLNREDLYIKAYKGLYCNGCEDFYSEKDLNEGFCPDHRTKPEQVEEENVFFRLSKYQKQLERLITSDEIQVFPVSKKNEVLGFIRQGLQDISLTRASFRSGGWGIAVPGNSDQTIYVWIDALVNYISGQGYGEDLRWEKVWNSSTHKVHVIGKNVWKFHAVYWPALLLSAGLPLPNQILIHGFLTNNGIKISKSLGNAIDPVGVVRDVGSDAIRHLILSHIPIFSDSDFSIEKLRTVYLKDLAHRLGNLYSRLLALCQKANFVPRVGAASVLSSIFESLITGFSFQEVSLGIWSEMDAINADINRQQPWKHFKKGDDQGLHDLLRGWCQKLYEVAKKLEPFIPVGSLRIQHGLEGKNDGGRILYPKL